MKTTRLILMTIVAIAASSSLVHARKITVDIPDDQFDSCSMQVGFTNGSLTFYSGKISGFDSYGEKQIYYMGDGVKTYKPNLVHDTNKTMNAIASELVRRGICPSIN